MKHVLEGVVWFEIKEGILVGKYEDNIKLDLEKVKAIVEMRLNAQNGISLPFLIDITGIQGVTKEARKYLGGPGAELISASAIISKSRIATIIFNFMTTVNLINKKIPIKFFDSYDEGYSWIEKYK